MVATSLDELIQRVESFAIDEGAPSFTFAQRLSRENAWSTEFTARVIREYRRFAILSVAAGHPVTPSEVVDQAWHLHLTYTRSYWQRFCPQALGVELHHQPTTGGDAETAKFFEWYARTLDSYLRIFGEQPPNDIWPSPQQRFRTAGQLRWYDASHFRLVPISQIQQTHSACGALIRFWSRLWSTRGHSP